MKHNRILASFVLAACLLLLPGAGLRSARAQALPTLLVPADTRSLAMGGQTLLPEAVAFKTLDVQLGYGAWAPQAAAQNVLSAALQVRLSPKFSLEADVVDWLGREYAITNTQATVKGHFMPYDLYAGLGARYAFSKSFSAALKAKLFHSVLGEGAAGTAFGVDAALSYKVAGFQATVAGSNLGAPIRYADGGTAYPLPMMLKAGLSYSVLGITPAVEVDYLFGSALMAAAGIEYDFKDIVFLRVGYHYGPADKALPSFVSLGLGVRYWGVSLNAACLLASKTLGNSLLVSLGYSF